MYGIRCFVGVSLLAVTFAASAGPKEIQYKMFYQAPETNNDWVFMLEQKELSGTKLKPSDLPEIQSRAKRSANRYCKIDGRWWDTSDKSGPGLWGDTVSLAEYVKVPLAKKQPDRIKLVYFSGSEDIVECETPKEARGSAEPGRLW